MVFPLLFHLFPPVRSSVSLEEQEVKVGYLVECVGKEDVKKSRKRGSPVQWKDLRWLMNLERYPHVLIGRRTRGQKAG